MTQLIPLPSAFSTPTTPFEVEVRGNQVIGAASPGARVYMLNVDLSMDALPSGAVEIDDYVAQLEQDPAIRVELEQARQEIRATIYGTDDPSSIRSLRLSKGLSQARLADAIGSTQAHIARIEAGHTNLHVQTIVRLARALDESPMAVFRALAQAGDA